MAKQERLFQLIETLIDTCRDGEKGYREAADHISDPELRAFFTEQSVERAGYAAALKDALEKLGKWETTRQGSVAGSLHRAWLEVKEHLGAGDGPILETVVAGENAAMKNYAEALQEWLPPAIRPMIEKQALTISAACDHLKLMHDRRKAA